jgi:hypothetical protein
VNLTRAIALPTLHDTVFARLHPFVNVRHACRVNDEEGESVRKRSVRALRRRRIVLWQAVIL